MKTCSNSNCPNLNPQPLDNFYKELKRNGKSGEWYTSRCKTCRDRALIARRHANKEKYNSDMRRFRAENPVDPKKESERQAKKYIAYKEKIDKRNAKWRQENLPLVAASTARYRSAKLQRTPKWLTLDQHREIKALYIAANNLSKSTGVDYEVDHIVPLRGKNVSGLNVPWNLQVLQKLGPGGNRSKQNKFSA